MVIDVLRHSSGMSKVENILDMSMAGVVWNAHQ